MKDFLDAGLNMRVPDNKGAVLSKWISVVFGAISFLLIFVVRQMDSVLKVITSLRDVRTSFSNWPTFECLLLAIIHLRYSSTHEISNMIDFKSLWFWIMYFLLDWVRFSGVIFDDVEIAGGERWEKRYSKFIKIFWKRDYVFVSPISYLFMILGGVVGK